MPPPNFATSALYALDNLAVMQGMDSETVHLIYADPPFNSKRIYQGMAGTRAAGHKFRDTWSWNDAKEEWLDQFANDWPGVADLLRVARRHGRRLHQRGLVRRRPRRRGTIWMWMTCPFDGPAPKAVQR